MSLWVILALAFLVPFCVLWLDLLGETLIAIQRRRRAKRRRGYIR